MLLYFTILEYQYKKNVLVFLNDHFIGSEKGGKDHKIYVDGLYLYAVVLLSWKTVWY